MTFTEFGAVKTGFSWVENSQSGIYIYILNRIEYISSHEALVVEDEEFEEDEEFSEDTSDFRELDRLIEKGKADSTSVATFTITVYYTKKLRWSNKMFAGVDEMIVPSSMVDIPTYIKKLIDETNVGYQNRQDPHLKHLIHKKLLTSVRFRCI